MLFYWNTSLETGNLTIDRQHRRLFDLANELAALVDGGGRLPNVSELVSSLSAYAAGHFSDEEKVMALSGLAAREQDRHIRAHRTFIERVEEIAARTDLSDVEVVEQYLEFIVFWLVSHILKMDQRLVRALQGDGLGNKSDHRSVERVLITALNETERRFRMISDDAPTFIWISGRSARRDYANRVWYEYVGVDRSIAASDVDWASFVHPDQLQQYQALLADLVIHPRPIEIELRILRPDGRWGWIIERVQPRVEGDRCVGLVAAASDITLIKHSEEVLAEANSRLEREVALRTQQLERMAQTDPLTGVGNRRYAFDHLQRQARARREGQSLNLSVLYLDIDHFKQINDSCGHSVGDEVLKTVAATLAAGLRPDDRLARVGGEEFVAILSGTNSEQAQGVAERLRAAVARLDFDEVEGRVTISIGASTLDGDESDEAMIKRADDALLEAKRTGRNRVCLWSSDLVPNG